MLLEDIKLNIHTARVHARANRTHEVAASTPKTAPRGSFRAWRAGRPFVGAVLTMIAGVEMFFSGQLDVGNIHVQVGIEGFQSTVIPVVVVTLGLLTMFNPVHRIFYGVISLVVVVYSLIGLNLGGFFIGMILGAIGGILIVSWIPKKSDAAEGRVDMVADKVADTTADATADITADIKADATNGTTIERRVPAAEPRPLVHSRS